MSEITIKIKDGIALLTSIINYNLELAENTKARKWEEPIVPYLLGSPGVGKTSIVMQAAELSKSEFIGFIGAQYDPAEMAGFIFFDKDSRETWRAKPDFLPTVGKHVVLCDEFGQMTMMQKNTMAQLLQERRLGEHHLSPHASLVIAGNRMRDRAGVQPDPSHVVDRVMKINMVADRQDWMEWALANGIHPSIVAYLKFRPNWFDQFDPQAEKNTTPRGWAKVSSILNIDFPKEVELACIAGQIGDGAATDFYGFLKIYRHLPDPDMILSDPKKHKEKIPNPNQKPDVMYALAGAIAHRATEKNMKQVIEFVRLIPQEFGAMLLTDACARDKTLHRSQDLINWKVRDGAATLLD